MTGRVLALVLAVVTLGLGHPAGALAAGSIRVALVERARTVEVKGIDVEVVPLLAGGGEVELRGASRWWRGDTVRAIATAQGVEIDGRASATGFRLRSGGGLRLNGRDYAGSVDLVRNPDGIVVVNELPLEEYLVGVLRAEAAERWPLEMLRAQAIAARTYAAYHRTIAGAKPYHIVASTAHQQYVGRVPTTSPMWVAVQDTVGQVLRLEGELFPAFYHTESGGYTEDPRLVFGARNMPALLPVRSEFSTGSPHFYWTLDVRLGPLGQTLRQQGVDVGAITAIEVTERTASLRAVLVTVHGTGGSARLRGNDFRRMVGYETLKSTLFAVAIDGEVAHFSGRGYGHGVGMCQWSAKGMAEHGYTARQILEFFYAGAVLGSLTGS